MKTVILLTLFLTLAAPCRAASCADTQNAATAAIKDRNDYAKGSINAIMPDPEETRGPLTDCLSSINSIGDAFTLGISLPSMDQLISGLCNQANSMIQQKMQEVLSEVRSTVSEIGRNNPLQVSGGGAGIVNNILTKLK